MFTTCSERHGRADVHDIVLVRQRLGSVLGHMFRNARIRIEWQVRTMLLAGSDRNEDECALTNVWPGLIDQLHERYTMGAFAEQRRKPSGMSTSLGKTNFMAARFMPVRVDTMPSRSTSRTFSTPT